MSCTSPIYRIDLLKFPQISKLPARFQRNPINDGVLISRSDFNELVSQGFNPDDFQILPCKQCFSCRMAYAREWAIRCQLESLFHEHSYFVTLTYDDYHLPKGDFLDYDGVIKDSSLLRSDVQKWLKRYRKKSKAEYGIDGIRVFYCGEYGELHDRPHYHALLFGTHEFDDLKLLSARGSVRHYSSDFLQSTWSENTLGKNLYSTIGRVSICEFTFDTAAYTARYMLKKQKGQSVRLLSEASERSGFAVRQNPFCGMSNRPGLARDYYEKHKDAIYKFDSVPYHKDFQVFYSKPPAYFDRLYDVDCPEDFEVLKDERIKSAIIDRHNNSLRVSESEAARDKRLEDIAIRKQKRSLRSL